MHVYNEIGLYGTASQMKATESDWEAAGNTLKPRGFRSVFGVPLKRARKDWVDTQIAEAKERALSTRGGRMVRLWHGGGRVRAPKGYRLLVDSEFPLESDVAWNAGANVWEPIDGKSLHSCGPQNFKKRAYGIIRKSS